MNYMSIYQYIIVKKTYQNIKVVMPWDVLSVMVRGMFQMISLGLLFFPNDVLNDCPSLYIYIFYIYMFITYNGIYYKYII